MAGSPAQIPLDRHLRNAAHQQVLLRLGHGVVSTMVAVTYRLRREPRLLRRRQPVLGCTQIGCAKSTRRHRDRRLVYTLTGWFRSQGPIRSLGRPWAPQIGPRQAHGRMLPASSTHREATWRAHMPPQPGQQAATEGAQVAGNSVVFRALSRGPLSTPPPTQEFPKPRPAHELTEFGRTGSHRLVASVNPSARAARPNTSRAIASGTHC